ncbi:unnamed protein product [Candidula unifasciata]|uniref:Signal transducer and activator of transcription n=1 Tax=Candidula unifasciata TaxID=100452 RepID=A0A8S3ZER2_9EUPU|nr:unnamed protein product [Candidula unifasciata]
MPDQTVHEGEQQPENDKIARAIHQLQLRTKSTDNELKSLKQKQESFILSFSDSQRINGMRQQLRQTMNSESPEFKQKENQLKNEKEQIEQKLAILANELLNLRIELSRKYEQTISGLQELQKEVLDNELLSWKRQQQLAGNGPIMSNSSLTTLQQWCDTLADMIWQNRQQVKKLAQLQQQLPIKDPEGREQPLPRLNDAITNLLSSLVTSTFVVEQQPPQVLKKDSRFSAAVSLLVGGRLNVHMNPPQVKVTIISEHQANDLLKPKSDFKTKDCSSGEILNNTGTMEYQANSGHLGITFRNMQLKKIKRADKKGSESVTEEKFCLLFQSEFSLGGNELVFQVWTLSLPVVVTVHGNQECNATATVLWDNAFAEPERLPFAVPDKVEWNFLADQLNLKFSYSTGRGLNQASLTYLASKLFGNNDPSTCKISWAQFNKDTLSNRSFTFWEWFYAILKLTKEHLKDLWMDDAIMGFVGKNEAQSLLSGQPYGTFLLRFSDSEIGGITIAWTGEKDVLNLAPFTAKDFNIRGLADRIRDLNSLVSLYPNRGKDLVFSKYYTPADEKMDPRGYVCPVLKTTIPKQFNSPGDVEIKQPFSQEYVYDSNLNSVQSMEEIPFMYSTESPEEFVDMDDCLNMLTDYMPNDIDEVNDINIEQLIESHNCTG